MSSLVQALIKPNDQKRDGFKHEIWIQDWLVDNAFHDTEDEAKEAMGKFLKQLKYDLRDLWVVGPGKG